MKSAISLDPEDGYWWIPGSEETQIPGRISLTGKGSATIELNGAFCEMFDVLSRKAPEYFGEIFGILKSGKLVTCFSCVRGKSNLQSPGYFTESYNASICLIGDHCRRNDVRVKRVSVECDNLYNWMGFELLTNEDPNQNAGFFIRLNRGLPVRSVLTRDCTIRFLEEVAYEGLSSQDTTIKKRLFASLFFWGEMDLVEAMNFSHTTISRLLSIACQKHCEANVLSLDLINRFNGKIHENMLVYKGRSDISNKTLKHEMLFSYEDCLESDFWETYFRSAKKYGVIYALFFELYMEKSRRTFEGKFLYLVRALEAFHRRYFDMSAIKSAHLRKIERICEGIQNKADAKYVFRRLHKGHEPPLEDKVKEISGIFPVEVRNHIEENFGASVWKEINQIRNYYAHFGDSPEPQSVRVIHINSVMEFLVKCSMLRMLGFSSEWIWEKFKAGRLVPEKSSHFNV